MNAQNIIAQISNNILNSNFSEPGETLVSNNNCMAKISDLISLSTKNDVPPPLISTDALDKSMLDIIKRFKNEDYAFVEMIAKAKLIGDARARLAEQIENPKTLSKGTMVLATVKGEYHGHGKNIVSSLSRGIGFNTIDLGMGTPANEILETVNEHKPEYLGISASVRATIPDLKEITDKIHEDNALENITVILGGYLAVDAEASSIDADYLCSNLHHTIDVLLNLAASSN